MPTDEPRYRDAVIIGWSLLWRGTGSFLLLLFLTNFAVIGLLPELTRTGPSLGALLLPLVAVSTLSALAVMPVIVRRLLRKRFAGFHLDFIRDRSEAPPCSAASSADRRAFHDTSHGRPDTRAGAVAHQLDRRAAGRSG
jgi:hypothetical protein